MHGIGFIPDIWINEAREAGLFPTSRAFIAATVIARAADLDGRWCFLCLDTLVSRSGHLLSLSVAKRAIADLIAAGLVRKLDPSQTRAFFAEDLKQRTRSPDRLPLVLELLIPAEDFPDRVREEINAVRATLGEEPLDEATRPRIRKAATVRIDLGDGSNRPAHLYPIHLSSDERPDSVRRSPTTAGQPEPARPSTHGRPPRTHLPHAQPQQAQPQHAHRSPGHPLLRRVPDVALNAPATDRAALTRALLRLRDAGLTEQELTALLRGAERLRRPFPALMLRLRGPAEARAFLAGVLGRGITPATPWQTGIPAPRRPADGRGPDDGDPFARPPGFDVDARGTAVRTCPEHPGVRNVPGGVCRACGGPCRSVPGELPHPPAPPEPEPPGPHGPNGAGEAIPGLEPALTERILASLMTGRPSAADVGRGREPGPARRTEPAHPPARQAIIDRIRRQLAA
ncbi:hypothetical protein NGM33_02615 [Nocardiopsis dassonvillei]|uniref:hypothetical protein n=1 Tax=Nocardiopsis dassonvillei TaxID=2014 RepID=UPI0020A4BDAA|nr:hypothetical protein [Nocardiopsis dassonvillei]MCP3012206.1 hypothetical protein [Nocardiopsis dassonvillei]